MATALKDRELLVQVRVPLLAPGSGAAYLKFPHPASRFAVVGVCAAVTLDKQGVCTKASVAVTGAGTKAVRAKGGEAGPPRQKLAPAARQGPGAKAPGGAGAEGAPHGPGGE